MSKLLPLPDPLKDLTKFSRRYVIEASEVAVIRHALRAMILDPGLTDRMAKYLPPEHLEAFPAMYQAVSYRWWHRATRFGLQHQYVAFQTVEETERTLPEGHAKRHSPPKPPKPPKPRGRPSNPDKWRSRLTYRTFKDAIQIRDWCDKCNIPMPASAKRKLGIPYSDLEGKEEAYCLDNGIPWHEYLMLRRDLWTPQRPESIHETPEMPPLPPRNPKQVSQHPQPSKSLRSDSHAPSSGGPQPCHATSEVVESEEAIKSRMMDD